MIAFAESAVCQQLRLHPSCSSGRPATRPFFRDDRALGEDLAAPDPVGFASLDRAGQADPAHRAGLAVCLGEMQVARQVREPQLRVLVVARQRIIQCLCLGSQQDQGAAHDLLPPGDRRGGVVAAGPHPAGTRTAAAAGDPVGVHDVRVARVDGWLLVPPVGRSALAPGSLDLFHVGASLQVGLAAGADVIGVGQVCKPKVLKARHAGRHSKVDNQVESSAAAWARKCRSRPAGARPDHPIRGIDQPGLGVLAL